MPIIAALRKDLSEKFISTFSSKKYSNLTLKPKKTIAALGGDIFHLTAFLVDIKNINFQTLGILYKFKITS